MVLKNHAAKSIYAMVLKKKTLLTPVHLSRQYGIYNFANKKKKMSGRPLAIIQARQAVT